MVNRERLTISRSSVKVFDCSTVSEPATIAIWSLLGLAGLGYGWRKRKAA
jgi:hypothetical protein